MSRVINITLDISPHPERCFIASVFALYKEVTLGLSYQDKYEEKKRFLDIAQKAFRSVGPLEDGYRDEVIEQISFLANRSNRAEVMQEFVSTALNFLQETEFVLQFDPVECEWLLANSIDKQLAICKTLKPLKGVVIKGIPTDIWLPPVVARALHEGIME